MSPHLATTRQIIHLSEHLPPFGQEFVLSAGPRGMTVYGMLSGDVAAWRSIDLVGVGVLSAPLPK